jgi:hypothetical protein
MAAREKNVWRFLHLFSGERDKLADALKTVAGDRGIQIEVESYDIAGAIISRTQGSWQG